VLHSYATVSVARTIKSRNLAVTHFNENGRNKLCVEFNTTLWNTFRICEGYSLSTED